MKVINSSDQLFLDCSVVTVGTFDGVHRGHRRVIEYCNQLSKKQACHAVVYTFFPHPRKVLGKGDFKYINSQAEKIYLFQKLGVEFVFLQEFTLTFAQKSAKQFIEEHLLKQLLLKDLVIGYDHQFGKDREGSFEVLKELSEHYHFRLHKIDALYHDNLTISSTKIRAALEEGNLSRANEMLGYPYVLMAKVVDGLKLGRKLGFPTANLFLDEHEKIIPKHGVYVVMVDIDGEFYQGVLSIGFRPTLNLPDSQLSIEVHLFDFCGDLYGKTLVVFFLERLRDDIKFDSLNELKHQIEFDILEAKKMFSKHLEWGDLKHNLFAMDINKKG
ncbi:MAG: bifunctional riboflavin kinase/FAD synthetase [Bacteroidales bacterium]